MLQNSQSSHGVTAKCEKYRYYDIGLGHVPSIRGILIRGDIVMAFWQNLPFWPKKKKSAFLQSLERNVDGYNKMRSDKCNENLIYTDPFDQSVMTQHTLAMMDRTVEKPKDDKDLAHYYGPTDNESIFEPDPKLLDRDTVLNAFQKLGMSSAYGTFGHPTERERELRASKYGWKQSKNYMPPVPELKVIIDDPFSNASFGIDLAAPDSDRTESWSGGGGESSGAGASESYSDSSSSSDTGGSSDN